MRYSESMTKSSLDTMSPSDFVRRLPLQIGSKVNERKKNFLKKKRGIRLLSLNVGHVGLECVVVRELGLELCVDLAQVLCNDVDEVAHIVLHRKLGHVPLEVLQVRVELG